MAAPTHTELIVGIKPDPKPAEKELSKIEKRAAKLKASIDKLKKSRSLTQSFAEPSGGGGFLNSLTGGLQGQFSALAGQGISLGITQGLIGSGIDQSSFLVQSLTAAGTGALSGGAIGAAMAVLGSGISRIAQDLTSVV